MFGAPLPFPNAPSLATSCLPNLSMFHSFFPLSLFVVITCSG